MTIYLGFFLAVIVGVTLGLVGSGGSILTVPILVSVFNIKPEVAFVYSLFIVGTTAIFGSIRAYSQKNIDLRIAFSFGVTSIISVYLTRVFIVPSLPEVLFKLGNFQLNKDSYLLLLFAILMLMASFTMIRKNNYLVDNNQQWIERNKRFIFIVSGIVVGVITGLVGAGGGFLIIPILFLIGRLPMNKAVGTSLMIISMNSIVGFVSNFHHKMNIDWVFLLSFSVFTVLGILIGAYLSRFIDGQKLKRIFGWFVMLLGLYIIISSLIY
ncbi:MAG: sulfite exporter TauE/SafE family protein [Crocinitomicaceae bacterium]|jgi:uncharacterized membrane protein YfcA